MFALQLHSQTPPLPTFHNQRRLPRLPVPKLKSTLEKYLRSIQPVLAEQKWDNGLGTGTSVEEEMQKRTEIARHFELGLGRVLQDRLIDLDRTSPHNWLDDNFWVRKAYLEWRQPLLIHSNWWLALKDDQTLPLQHRQDYTQETFTTHQLRRAAWVVSRLLDFKDHLARHTIPPDATRSGPLCMSHYTRIYNICRIPQPKCDDLTRILPPESKEGRHVFVMAKDFCYSMDVTDHRGLFIGAGEIQRRLVDIAKDVEAREQNDGPAIPVGILTSDDRDTWAANREHLLSLSPRNRESLSQIESSLFGLSLDSYTLGPVGHASLVTNPTMDAHLHNIRSGRNGRNRWFDKSITICIESNARAGMMGEHSPCDALIPSILGDYVVGIDMPQLVEGSEGEGSPDETGGKDHTGWQRLEFATDSRIVGACKEAEQKAAKLIADSDDSMFWFDDHATDWIRNAANMAPDAYIQMALQLAWFKNQRHFTATYETASTRIFTHGRTEVIRSLSAESRAFVLGMTDPERSDVERHSLLSAAVKAHNAYTRDASTGRGIDRHLMALRLLMREGERAALFEDDVFDKSQEWKLSTSGLSAGDRFIGTGFGAPYSTGYGINYLAGPDRLKFGIESKHSCTGTSTEAFKLELRASLLAMRALCERVNEERRQGGGETVARL